jgi:hypothetical protein
MSRIVISMCFALTLLCPIVCLANNGDECASHESLMGDNCEAMLFGAVVEKPSSDVVSQAHSLPAFDSFVLLTSFSSGCDFRLQCGLQYEERCQPPPTAARRHSLLQSFLF